MKHVLLHKTTGYYAVVEDPASGFRTTAVESEATRFDDFDAAERARFRFESFSGAWMSVPARRIR